VTSKLGEYHLLMSDRYILQTSLTVCTGHIVNTLDPIVWSAVLDFFFPAPPHGFEQPNKLGLTRFKFKVRTDSHLNQYSKSFLLPRAASRKALVMRPVVVPAK